MAEKKPKGSFSNANQSQSKAFGLAKIDAAMEGKLKFTKPGSSKKSTTDYHFLLGSKSLYYSLAADASTPVGEIPLDSIHSILTDGAIVKIVTNDSQTFLLQAIGDSPNKEAAVWAEKIQSITEDRRNKLYSHAQEKHIERSLYIRAWEGKIPICDSFCTMEGKTDKMSTEVEMGRTATIWQSDRPIWDGAFTLNIPSDLTEMRVWLHQQIGERLVSKLGYVSFNLKDIENKEHLGWFPVTGLGSSASILFTIDNSNQITEATLKSSSSSARSYFLKIEAGGTKFESGLSVNGVWKLPSWDIKNQSQDLVVQVSDENGVLVGKSILSHQALTTDKAVVLEVVSVGQVRVEYKYSVTLVYPDSIYENLFVLMCSENTYLCKAISKGKEDILGPVASKLVNIFELKQCGTHYIKSLIEMDIQQCSSPQVLFRLNTLATKSLEYYMKLVGIPHLIRILKPFVAELSREKKSCEVDFHKLDDLKLLKKNAERLLSYTSQVFDAINKAISWIPVSIRSILASLRKMIVAKWPNVEDHATALYVGPSAFVFLRFICPALLTPKQFNVTTEPSPTFPRNMALITKVLQGLANLAVFGQKEPYMISANEWIIKETPRMKKLLDEFCTVPTIAVDQTPIDHQEMNWGRDMATISQVLISKVDVMSKDTFGSDPLFPKLIHVLMDIRDPDDKNTEQALKAQLSPYLPQQSQLVPDLSAKPSKSPRSISPRERDPSASNSSPASAGPSQLRRSSSHKTNQPTKKDRNSHKQAKLSARENSSNRRLSSGLDRELDQHTSNPGSNKSKQPEPEDSRKLEQKLRELQDAYRALQLENSRLENENAVLKAENDALKNKNPKKAEKHKSK